MLAIQAIVSLVTAIITMKFCHYGETPPDSIDRMEEDELIPPRSLARIAPGKEEAILKAMSVQQDKHYQTMAEFREALLR